MTEDERYERAILRHWAREQAVGVLPIKLFSDYCWVCHGWLDASLRWPHPMAITVGHEPPLSRTRPGDKVFRRDEHWICNLRKGTRTDAELPAQLRVPPYPVLSRCGPDPEGDRKRRKLLVRDVWDLENPENPSSALSARTPRFRGFRRVA